MNFGPASLILDQRFSKKKGRFPASSNLAHVMPRLLHMKMLHLISFAFLTFASPLAFAQTHPSENYPGKGGNQDATNGAPNSPEQQNPSTGTQNTPTNPPDKSGK
jgi:hypothetical protein